MNARTVRIFSTYKVILHFIELNFWTNGLKYKNALSKLILELKNATVPMCSFLVLYVQIIFKSTTSIVDAYMQFKRNELAKSS